MKVALGFKSHSGWAAMIAIGEDGHGFQVIDRGRIELIEEGETWAKQPYHAAEEHEATDAEILVEKGIDSARRTALSQMRESIRRLRKSGHDAVICGVIVPTPMPNWSTAEILAVHFRMHKAEGVLFPDALCRAADACKLPLARVPEKQLDGLAEKVLMMPTEKSKEMLVALGKSIGPPWGRDQKVASLAAMIAFKES